MVTERKQEEASIPLELVQKIGSGISSLLQASEVETTLLLLNAVGDGVVGLDRNASIIYCNQAARGLLGFTNTELLGRRLEEFFERPEGARLLFDPILQGDVVSTDEILLLSRKSLSVEMIITAVPLMDHGQVQGALIIFRDITPGILISRTLKEREEVLRGVFYMLPAGIILMDPFGRIVRINEAARQLLDLGDRELRGEAYPERMWSARDVDGNPIAFADAPFQQALKTGEPVKERLVQLGSAAQPLYALISSNPLLISAGEEGTRMIVTTITDVNRQLLVQSKLQTAVLLNGQINNLLKNILTEMIPEETVDTALRGVCELMKADFALLGLLDDDKKRVTYDYIYGFPEIFRGHSRPFAGSISETMFEMRRSAIIPDYAASPRRIDACVRAGAKTFLGSPISADQEPLGSILLFRNRPEPFTAAEAESLESLAPVLSAALYKATYERKLRDLATNDPLTGIWNRRVFFEHLEMEIERSKRYGTPLSLLILDLDHFKEVNDAYGHQAGDAVLSAFSGVMKRTTRRTDMIGRTGGEEFMAILPDTPLAGAERTAEKLRSDVEQLRVPIKGGAISVTVSIGCAEYRRGEPFDEYYGRVDRLLYRAKNEGRNRVIAET